MAWWIEPLEIADENGNPTGKWRLTAKSDEGGGGPYGDTSHSHDSAEAAQGCRQCQEYCYPMAGFPPPSDTRSEDGLQTIAKIEGQEPPKKVWGCKIGEVDAAKLPRDSDSGMRRAVADMYQQLTGELPEFIFSGWGEELTEAERAVVENRLPDPSVAGQTDISPWNPIEYLHGSKGEVHLPAGAPFDGEPVLIRTNTGVVEAWWAGAETHQTPNGSETTGFCWVCYDDKFQLELDDAKGWMPLPGTVAAKEPESHE